MYSSRVHFSEAMSQLTVFSFIEPRGLPGSQSRKRAASRLWHIMSLSTPPPCSSPSQNHGI